MERPDRRELSELILDMTYGELTSFAEALFNVIEAHKIEVSDNMELAAGLHRWAETENNTTTRR